MKIYTQKVGFFLKKQICKVFETAINVLGEDGSSASVSVVLLTEGEIKTLNKEKRNIDMATDVLSFPFFNKTPNDRICDLTKDEFGEIYLGDIAICKSIAKKQAKEYGHSQKRELCFLALHGFLHILGYDHIKDEDRQVMENLQEQILTKCKVTRDD